MGRARASCRASLADALVEVAGAYLSGKIATAGNPDIYQVIVHVGPEALTDGPDPVTAPLTAHHAAPVPTPDEEPAPAPAPSSPPPHPVAAPSGVSAETPGGTPPGPAAGPQGRPG